MTRRLAASRPAPWSAVRSVRAPVPLIPGVGILEGAVVGAVVGGLAGAIWADQDNDGRVDGYVRRRPILSWRAARCRADLCAPGA